MRARLIVTLVLAMVVVSCGDDDGLLPTSTIEGSTTSSIDVVGGSTTVAPTTTGVGSFDESIWERIAEENVGFGPGKQGMSSVAESNLGLVAVGWDISSGDADAAFWTSVDGIAWEEAVVGGPGTQIVNAVSVNGSLQVAVGYDSSGGDDDAAVWVSTDGLTWSRVPHDEAVFGGPGGEQMLGVTAGGPGFVAVGWGNSGDDEAATAWVSADGYRWERIADTAVFGGPGAQGMMSVVAAGPGLVAVGSDFEGDFVAAVWTSPDGYTWSQVPYDADVFGGQIGVYMYSVAIAGPGLVAVGSDYSGFDADAAVWTSRDGLAWSRVPHDESVFGGSLNQEMRGVATSGVQGIAAVGWDDSGEAGDAAVWSSVDGRTWLRVAAPAVFGGPRLQTMAGVTSSSFGLVAVGLDRNPDGGEQHSVVWLARPSD